MLGIRYGAGQQQGVLLDVCPCYLAYNQLLLMHVQAMRSLLLEERGVGDNRYECYCCMAGTHDHI